MFSKLLTKDMYIEYIKNSQNSIIRNNPIFKMGKTFEHILHLRRNMDGK